VIARHLLIALQFLTRVPVHLNGAPDERELGHSLLWYPVVGALVGLMLWGLAACLNHTALPLRAGLLLAAWVLATGALHIDGLADTADAWMGGHGQRERMLAIMKDPHIGSGAVTVVSIVLLLKFAALCALLGGRNDAVLLLLPPLLARCAIPALFVSTPYVRSQGIASAYAAQLPRNLAVAVVVASMTGVVLLFATVGALAIVVASSSFALLRHGFIRHLNGMTGDAAGAMIELIETSVLILIGLRS
jgi:adenosylcobinamide-GDP ribazoletransferase